VANYSISEEHRHVIELAGLTEEVVLAALHLHPRMVRELSEDRVVVYVPVSTPPVVIALTEVGDDDWEVTNARPMDTDETKRFMRIQKGIDND
jgi:hypothetical protein